jgi:hypothetical protein
MFALPQLSSVESLSVMPTDAYAAQMLSIAVLLEQVGEKGMAQDARKLAQGIPLVVHTALGAVWCPLCGTCSCPDRSALDDFSCRLHGPASHHGALESAS